MLGPPQWIRESMSACLRHRSDVSRVERWDVHVPLSGGRGVAVGATSCTSKLYGCRYGCRLRVELEAGCVRLSTVGRVRVLCTCHVSRLQGVLLGRFLLVPRPAGPHVAMGHGHGPWGRASAQRDELRNANPNALRRTERSAETGERERETAEQDSLDPWSLHRASRHTAEPRESRET